MPESNEPWPPAPSRAAIVHTVPVNPKVAVGLLTSHFLWDSLLGLILGPILHVLLLVFFVSLGLHARLNQYVGWGFAVLSGILLFALLLRRYPYLMVGFIATNLPVAIFSYFIIGLGIAAQSLTD